MSLKPEKIEKHPGISSAYKKIFSLTQIFLVLFLCCQYVYADAIVPQALAALGINMGQLFIITSSLAAVSVGVGVFMKFFSLGKLNTIEQGSMIIRWALIGWFVINTTVLSLNFIEYPMLLNHAGSHSGPRAATPTPVRIFASYNNTITPTPTTAITRAEEPVDEVQPEVTGFWQRIKDILMALLELLEDAKVMILVFAFLIVGITVGIGVFMQKLSMGNRENIERGRKIVKTSLTAFFIVVFLDSILFYLNPDMEIPTAPTDLVISNETIHGLKLSWKASTDDMGVRNYSVYRDGNYISSLTATVFEDKSLDSNTSYTYTVTATDMYKKTSEHSNPVTGRTLEIIIDSTAPTAPTVSSPSNGSYTNQDTVTVMGTKESGAYVEIAGGSTTAKVEADSETSFSQSVTLNQNQTNTLNVYQVDAAGNQSPSTSISIIHDNIAPSPPNVTLLPRYTIGSGASISGSRESGASISVYRSGSPVATYSSDSNTTFTVDVDLNSNAGNSFDVYQTDAAGNTSLASTVSTTSIDWEDVGSSWSGDNGGIAIKLYNNTPYVAYRGASSPYKPSVYKYVSSGWSAVGSTPFPANTVNYVSMELDSNGMPYVAYQDTNNNNYRASCKYYDGSNWLDAGSAGFSGVRASNISMTRYGSTIYACMGCTTDMYTSDYKASVYKYSGSSWSAVGSERFSDGYSYGNRIAVYNDSNIYSVFCDKTNYTDTFGKLSVYKYNGSSWSVVGSRQFSNYANLNSPEAIVLDSSGTPYVAYSDINDPGERVTVMKYNGSGWSNVGSERFTLKNSYTSKLSMAISSGGYIYVACYSGYGNSYKLKVYYYDLNTSSDWRQLGSQLHSGNAGSTWMSTDSLGNPYISYVSNYSVHVKKLMISNSKTILFVDSSSESEIKLKWNSSDADYYEVSGNNTSINTTDTNCTFSNLTSNTLYTFTIIPKYSVGVDGVGSSISVATACTNILTQYCLSNQTNNYFGVAAYWDKGGEYKKFSYAKFLRRRQGYGSNAPISLESGEMSLSFSTMKRDDSSTWTRYDNGNDIIKAWFVPFNKYSYEVKIYFTDGSNITSGEKSCSRFSTAWSSP